MKFYKILISIFVICTLQQSYSVPIKIILTAALTDNYFEERKQQYIECLEILEEYGYKDEVYIVEALKRNGPTFLDNYCKNILYSKANRFYLKNQGVNESMTLLNAFYYFKFQPEDMIVKMTGRYKFLSDSFLRFLEENCDNYDAFVRIDFWQPGDAATGCFAMKGKYFKEMYESIDYNFLENAMVSIEFAVGRYIARKVQEGNFKVYYVDNFGIHMSRKESSICPVNADMSL